MVNSGKLTKAEHDLMALCVGENQSGRIAWPLSTWEGGAKALCSPLVTAGFLIERRLGGYPGVQITDAGRAALAAAKGE